jgi:FkbM family methyltransferase
MGIDLMQQLDKVEKLACASRINRLLHNPYKYITAIFFKEFVYPRKKQEKIDTADLFYGKKMKIGLPASTDIYLNGGKSHDSEIRLARFIILNLGAGGHFLDIGAHYGYFTLLAAEIAGGEGKVVAFEPAGMSYDLLKENTGHLAHVTALPKAVSHNTDSLVFYEFPNLYSEYNSTDVSQFEKEDWFQRFPPRRVEVPATTIDEVTTGHNFVPGIIKIDVEGAEFSVIRGGVQFLRLHAPFIVMEYLEPKRHNEEHKKAFDLMIELGYRSYLIRKDGTLMPVTDIDTYLTEQKLESDNIVFQKA